MINIRETSRCKLLVFAFSISGLSFGSCAFGQVVADCANLGSDCSIDIADATNDGSSTSTTSIIIGSNEVCAENTASALSATVDIAHTWVGDLTITLDSPLAGPATILLDRLENEQMPSVTGGCDGNVESVTFSDAGQAQSCFTRETGDVVLVPDSGTMADLIDGSVAGTWQLALTDANAGNFGTLNAWSLEFDCEPGDGITIFNDSFESSP